MVTNAEGLVGPAGQVGGVAGSFRERVATIRHRRALNRRRRVEESTAATNVPGTYVVLLTLIAVLNIVGVVMVLSASSVSSLDTYGSAWFVFRRQVIWVACGGFAFLVGSRLDYHRWRKWVMPMLFLSLALLALVLVPGVGIRVQGSTRWLGFGSMRFQPSEVAKFAVLIYCAEVLTRRANELHDWKRALRPILGMLSLFGLLVMLEPDMGSTIIVIVIGVSLLFVGGIRLRHLLHVVGAGLGIGLVLAIVEPYRRARLFSFFDPIHHMADDGYQVVQSWVALGSGGWTGVGLGAGRAKWAFLPNAHTDFILAIVGEELGLIGCVAIIGLFVAFGIVGARIALQAPDRFGMLVAAGVTVWVCLQAFINVCAVIGLLPVTGIPLPFVSFGGSSLLFTMLGTGVLANIARRGRVAGGG